jgi:excisionase family DNA binding protein
MTERTAYRLSEVRAALGISRTTLYRWIDEGKIKVTRLCGRSFVMREDHPAPPVHVPVHVSAPDAAEQNETIRDRLKIVQP